MLRTMDPSPHVCHDLAATADRLAVDAASPRAFLVELAVVAAGIRRGPLVVVDLALGGRNPMVGGGFRPELDDGSPFQVRHFVGVARSVTLLGGRLTRLLSETARLDPRDTPDGRLTDLGQLFARLVLDGDLPLGDTGAWIRHHVCASDTDR